MDWKTAYTELTAWLIFRSKQPNTGGADAFGEAAAKAMALGVDVINDEVMTTIVERAPTGGGN